MAGPWKKITPGYGKMVLGYFGKTPVEPDPKVVKIASEQLGLEPTKKTVLELNDADPKKGLKVAEQKLKENNLPITDENKFIVATCADKGILFLKGQSKINGIRWAADAKKAASADTGAVKVTVNGQAYEVIFDGDNAATVNGKRYDISTSASDAKAPAATAASGNGATVKAPVPGAVLRFSVKDGDRVSEGQEIVVLEAMKMETPVAAPATGVIHFTVKQGDQVQTGHTLAEIK